MMRRTSLYVDDDLWHAFRQKCLEQRKSATKEMAELIRQFITDSPEHSQSCKAVDCPEAKELTALIRELLRALSTKNPVEHAASRHDFAIHGIHMVKES